jgi:hypothetical protein
VKNRPATLLIAAAILVGCGGGKGDDAAANKRFCATYDEKVSLAGIERGSGVAGLMANIRAIRDASPSAAFRSDVDAFLVALDADEVEKSRPSYQAAKRDRDARIHVYIKETCGFDDRMF